MSSIEVEQKIEETLRRYEMLSGGFVVVGLSGGADSMTLAHFLHRRGVKLIAAHVNHGLRGAESQRDEEFVRRWCAKNEIPLKVLNADVRGEAERLGIGLEECGRRLRYSFFEALAGSDGRIATAHTLSDSTETVLLNLTRGTGTKGLCGIPPVRGNIIRPLLEITRQEVEQYCEYYQLEFIQDSSNFSRDYSRNRVRLDVIPVLKQLNPSFEAAVLRTTRQLEEEERYLSGLAEEALEKSESDGGYCLKSLKVLPNPVLTRAVATIAKRAGYGGLSANNILEGAELIRSGAGAVTTAGGLLLRVERGFLYALPLNWLKISVSTPLCLPKTLTGDGRTVIIDTVNREEYENRLKFHKLLFYNAVNYDTILGNTFLRTRREGDVFRPAGRGVTKTLKKLLNEKKIPVCKRESLLMLERDGTILWIEGIGPSEEARAAGSKIALLVIRECSK